MVSRGKENEKIKPLLKKLFFKLSYSYEKTNSFSFVLPLASASQWGALYDYEGEDASSKAGENYLLRYFIEGKKIYIDLDVEEKDTKNIAKYKKMIDQAFWDWISYPMDLIREQGREAEFADLNDVYGKGLSIEFSKPKQGKSDLRIYVRSTMDVMVRCRSTAVMFLKGNMSPFRKFGYPEIIGYSV